MIRLPKSLLPWFCLMIVCVMVGLVGCNHGPATAFVTGKVTFDGKPLAKATLEFNPESGERSSFGYTKEDGTFELKFSAATIGAVPGLHRVIIRTAPSEVDPSETMPKEILPAKYNAKSELTQTLKNGKQVINFDLTP